jgi:hypothetical protein
MSQIIKNLASGPVPPSVATSYVTDSGTAVPSANVLNVKGGTQSLSVDNGILTTAGPSNQINIDLTNRVQGRITTTDASNQTLISFALSASAATYNFDANISAYDVTDDLGAGYSIFGSVRSTASTAFLVGTPDKIVNEEPSTVNCDANLVVSGNNAIIQVNGLAGKTINWNCVLTYVAQTKV